MIYKTEGLITADSQNVSILTFDTKIQTTTKLLTHSVEMGVSEANDKNEIQIERLSFVKWCLIQRVCSMRFVIVNLLVLRILR